MELRMMTNKKQAKKLKIKSILIGIAAFFIVAMSLFQAPFKRYSKEYSEHYKTYNSIINKRNSTQDSLLNELGKSLTIEKYKIEREEAWSNSQLLLKKYTSKKRKLAKEHSFLGRSSFKFWIFQFGIILLGFYFSIRSLIEDLKKDIKTGHEIISILGISISLFWLYHLFFKTANDFYAETYYLFEFLVSVGVGFFISRLIKYYTVKKGIISDLVDLILRIKTTHYRKMVVKALYAEKYDKSIDSIETVKMEANEFDKDISNTFDKYA